MQADVAQANFAPDATEKFRDAIEAFDAIDLKPAIKAYHLAPLITALAFSCMGSGDAKCARDALQRHPLGTQTFDGGPWRDHLVGYLSVYALYSRIADEPFPTRLRQTFDKSFGDRSTLRSDFKGFLEIARGLVLWKEDQREAATLIRDGFKHVVEYEGARNAISLDQIRLPSVYERFLAMTTVLLLAKDGAHLSRDDADLALAALEVLQRNANSAQQDLLRVLAQIPNPDSRGAINSWVRVSNRQVEWIKQRLPTAINFVVRATEGEQPRQNQALDGLRLSELELFISTKAQLQASLQAASVNWAAARSAVSAAEVQSVLGAEEVVVQQDGFGGQLMSLCISKDNVSVTVKSATVDEFKTALNDLSVLRTALTATHGMSDEVDAHYPVSEAIRLYDFLVRPLSGCITRARHVIWITGGNSEIPIHALLSSSPPAHPKYAGAFDLERAEWFGRRYALSYGISATAFTASRRLAHDRTLKRNILAMGAPALLSTDGTGLTRGARLLQRSGAYRSASIRELEELPDAKQELLGIANIVGQGRVEVLTGEAATEKAFRRELLNRYGILHFATHGLVAEDVPGLREAALVLTPPVTTTPDNDGLLTSSEIAALQLDAKLVVLSACNTANFDFGLFSSEMSGLSSAFALAGVPTIVATIWPVETRAAQQFVESLYKKIERRSAVTVAEALRQTVDSELTQFGSRSYFHPRFWGPFVVLGDGGVALEMKEELHGANVLGDGTDSADGKKRIEIRSVFYDDSANLLGFNGVLSLSTNRAALMGLGKDARDTFTILRLLEMPSRKPLKEVRLENFLSFGEAAVSAGVVYILGRTKVNDVVHMVVKGLSLDLRMLWERRLDNIYSAAITADHDGVAIAGFQYVEGDKVGTVALMHFTDRGTVAKKGTASIQLPQDLPRLSLIAVDDRVVVAVSGENRPTRHARYVAPTGFLTDCGNERWSSVTSFAENTFKEQRTVQYEDLVITSLTGKDGRQFIASGYYSDNCTLHFRGVLLSITPGLETKPLVTFDAPIAIALMHVVYTDRNTLMAIGYASRRTGALDLQSIVTDTERRGVPLQEYSKDLLSESVKNTTVSDQFIVEVAMDGTLLRREDFRTGSAMGLGRMEKINDDWLLTGRIGDTPSLVTIR